MRQKIGIKQILLAVTISIISSGCGESSAPTKADISIHEVENSSIESINTYEKKKELRLESEPSSYRKYALVANGKITVKHKLTTDGPLADVHANGLISANTRSLDISGRITSQNKLDNAITRSFNYKSNAESKATIAIRALKVSEFIHLNNVLSYYHLDKNGKITKIEEGVSTDINSIDGADISYKNGAWTITGEDIRILDTLKVDGDLNINANNTFVSGALLVSGDLVSTGELNINVGTPFDSALVVNKSIQVDKLITIGRVHSSSNFVAKDTVSIVGNAEIDGDVELYGDAKINMLDNVYKAAMADAQEESEKNGKDVTLVHSQLFSDVKGNNSVVLFTFVEGNYLMNKKILDKLITSKEINDFNFTSSLYGASIEYVSQLSKADHLSSFYENLLLVKQELNKTYGEVKVKKYIDIAPSNFYCQFVDANNQDIGTYLIYSLSQGKISTLISLTDAQKEKALEEIDHPKKLDDDVANTKIEDINITDSNITENAPSEYLELDNNISTAIATTDKEAIAKEDKESRINEWVEYQELGSENKVVEMKEVAIADQNATAQQRGWFSRAWKRVRRVFRKLTLTDCHKKREHGEIRGVNENQITMRDENLRNDNTWASDDWTKFVTLHNDAQFCTPTAAAMVMQYHAKVHYNKTSLYSNDGNWFSQTANNRSSVNPYVAKWAGYLHSSTEDGTNAWNTFIRLPYRVYIQARDNGMSWGWAYSYYTAVWSRAWQFRYMKWYLSRNRPGIYHAPTNTITWNPNTGGSIDQDVYHSMPIIGWKTESYGGWCAKKIWPNKNWLLLDTEFGFKQYVRFDSRSRYWKVGAISYIWVQ